MIERDVLGILQQKAADRLDPHIRERDALGHPLGNPDDPARRRRARDGQVGDVDVVEIGNILRLARFGVVGTNVGPEVGVPVVESRTVSGCQM